MVTVAWAGKYTTLTPITTTNNTLCTSYWLNTELCMFSYWVLTKHLKHLYFKISKLKCQLLKGPDHSHAAVKAGFKCLLSEINECKCLEQYLAKNKCYVFAVIILILSLSHDIILSSYIKQPTKMWKIDLYIVQMQPKEGKFCWKAQFQTQITIAHFCCFPLNFGVIKLQSIAAKWCWLILLFWSFQLHPSHRPNFCSTKDSPIYRTTRTAHPW